ncbi:MAG: phosphogluconate dehydratase [Gaiellaceae bacterium]|nr:phosphogluconate dehydratase [Gaiellaceae bacterium]
MSIRTGDARSVYGQHMDATVASVTERVVERSRDERAAYLDRVRRAKSEGPQRRTLSCGNLAHGAAACGIADKHDLLRDVKPNLAIVSAYNDILSAHQPLGEYPALLKAAAAEGGAIAQFAGGVPAMCDGVTQGRTGMELSLFSRDVIAMSTAVALSHDLFDGVLALGVCDKIVPGLLIGMLSFGHLPSILVPAGPMPSGLPNKEKARIRQLHVEGKIGREQLIEAEAQSYHSPGTCTFYGTANSNQMLVEMMGLHVPGAAFVNPGTALRTALTAAAARRLATLAAAGDGYGIGEIIDERALVNGIVAMLATGGSTNHTIHLVAVARAAGITLTWDDFADLSRVVPLLARVYPNGAADVNEFERAGGTSFLVAQLLRAGLMHADVRTVAGDGLAAYAQKPFLDDDGSLAWRPPPADSLDPDVLRRVDDPFDAEGGLRLVSGNLGRAICKVSAVEQEHRRVRAPVAVFDDQDAVLECFSRGELDRDVVVVLRFQGPRANGMPELHKLSPALGVLQDRGHEVALVTDGRMSGASGKVPTALHVSPETIASSTLARLRDGDFVTLDADRGILEVERTESELARRRPAAAPDHGSHGTGRELFATLRGVVSSPEEGATSFADGGSR